MQNDLEINGKRIPAWIVEILIKRIGSMPPNIKLAVLGTVLTKEDILKEVNSRSPFGLELLKMEAEYYYDLVRD